MAIELVVPATEEAALDALAGAAPGEVAVLAGGTDLLLDIDEGRAAPRRLLSLRRLPWRRHAWYRGGLVIGATEPLRTLEQDVDLARRLPGLADAIAAVGSPALRRQATVGGNLGRAAPASDLAPALLALDAEVELVGRTGSRTVPLDRLLRASRSTDRRSDELVRSVRVHEERVASAYLWQRVRPANDISQIGVAVAFGSADRRWRVSLGGVPPRPVLAGEVGRALGGLPPGATEIAAASTRLAADPALVSDRRATEEHRRRLASVLCARAVATAVERAGGPR